MTGTLLFDLTSSTDADGFPATELSKQLIEYAGQDVGQFRRNQQIAYHLVEQTRDAYERIVPLIRRLEDSQPTEDNWEDFVRYTDAVDALEKFLFKVLDTSEDEAQRHLSAATDIVTCIAEADTWEKNRRALREAAVQVSTDIRLTALFPDGVSKAIKAEIPSAEEQDDLAFYSELQAKMSGHKVMEILNEDLVKCLTDIEGYLRRIKDIIIDLRIVKNSVHLITVAIKFAFVLQGTMEIAVKESTDPTWKAHLTSGRVWEGARDLANHLSREEQSHQKYPTWASHYIAFVQILQDIIANRPRQTWLQYSNAVGSIQRPYIPRSLATIILCRALTGLIDDNRTGKRPGNLVETLQDTIDVLKTTKDAIQDTERMKTSEIGDANIGQSFHLVDNQVEAAFISLHNDFKSPNRVEDPRRQGQQGSTQIPMRTGSNSVDIVVDIHQSEVPTRTLGFSVHPATRLSTVRSYIASDLGEPEDLCEAGHFRLEGEECTPDLSVGELRNEESGCHLTFHLPRLV